MTFMVRAFAFSVAASLLYACLEQAVVQARRTEGHLASAFFYYPGMALSVAMLLGLFFGCALGIRLLCVLRPSIEPGRASITVIVVVVGLLPFVPHAVGPLAWLADGHFAPFPGLTLGILTIAGGYFALARLLLNRLPVPARGAKTGPGGKANGLRTIGAVAAGGLLTLTTWNPIHNTLVTLYSSYLLIVAGPLIVLTSLLYLIPRKASDATIRMIVRVGLSLGFAACALSYLIHLFDHFEWTVAMSVAAVFVIAIGVFLMHLRRDRVAFLVMPGVFLTAIFLAPFAEDAWRPTVPESLWQKERVVIITVDTLRRDVISAYNPETPTTPNIDGLMVAGARFDQSWSAGSWTLPSIVSMMTGVRPRVHQVNSFESTVPPNLKTLGEHLQDRGFRTHAVVENILLKPELGLARGFDRYIHLPGNEGRLTLGLRALHRFWPLRYNPAGGGRALAEMAWRRARQSRNEKSLIWLHLYDPHADYRPPAPFWPEGVPRNTPNPAGPNKTQRKKEIMRRYNEEWRQLYLGEVQYTDFVIGIFLDRLRAMNLYESSWIVFTSDHGEEFGEEGRWGHRGPPVESLAWMPLGLKRPGTASPQSIPALVSTASLTPTILEAVDGSFRKPSHMLPPWIRRNAGRIVVSPAEREMVVATSTPERAEAIIFGEVPYQYLLDHQAEEERLIDLESERAERESKGDADVALPERGRQYLQAYESRAKRIREDLNLKEGATLEYSEEELTEIRNLGYVE